MVVGAARVGGQVAGSLAGGSLLMGWERPGPDSILPRGSQPTPLRLSIFALFLCAQALHKAF